jgi:asparagine synthetase B (glutamine-hydrolysing)
LCSFAVTNFRKSLRDSNFFAKYRGPDATTSTCIGGISFLHNLLHITGKPKNQPQYSNDVAVLFNGEIYNYLQLGGYNSEVEAILDLYLQEGPTAFVLLDGEFAICLVDFRKQRLIIATDTFATKPLWFDVGQSGFCVASYKSQLLGIGCKTPAKLGANQIHEFCLSSGKPIKQTQLYKFSTKQFKSSFDDWNLAFEQSISKRIDSLQFPMFIGLSSGMDSGAIACELNKRNAQFHSFSIFESENPTILNQRKNVLGKIDQVQLTLAKAMHYRLELGRRCEGFQQKKSDYIYDVRNDPGAIGLAAICDKAQTSGCKVYLSGQGADEIFSDYGFNGKKLSMQSTFAGLYPDDLTRTWPWPNFFEGTQSQYLGKEEVVVGGYGLEARYPFLDRVLVQEFLNLKPALKNSKYKSVLTNYLEENSFPFDPGVKIGFDPMQTLLNKE